jgi:exopolysaccharide biosynthesis polyprenyl glycosylphosphotransferase
MTTASLGQQRHEFTISWTFSRYRTKAMHTLTLVVGDTLVIVAAAEIAILCRDTLLIFDPAPPNLVRTILPIEALFVGLWLTMLAGVGAYQIGKVGVGSAEFNAVLLGTFFAAGALGVTAYLTGYDLSRGFYVLLFIVGLPLLLFERYVTRRLVRILRNNGVLCAPVILVGDHQHVDEIAAVLRRATYLGYRVVGVLSPSSEDELTPSGLPVLGSLDDILPALRATAAQAVIFTDGALPSASAFNRLARQLEDQDAQLVVVPGLADVSAARMNLRPVGGLPLVYVERPRAALAMRWGKRLFDVVGAVLALVLAAPVMALIALAIKIEDRGPVVFKQNRIGLKGQPFGFYKFRSMGVDAEQQLAQLQNEGNGVLFKMKSDPRVTRVGRFIRRLSLDELPQLLNVLQGQMSLVGPRPALPREVALYQQDVHRRLDVRPGLTGLWQVSGRSDLSWDDTVRLDLYYVDNWSLLQDLMIVTRTVGAVLRPRGAY